MVASGPIVGNPIRVRLEEIDRLAPEAFSAACIAGCRAGARLGALVALPTESDALAVIAVMIDDERSGMTILRTTLRPGESYPSISASCPQAQALERAIYE